MNNIMILISMANIVNITIIINIYIYIYIYIFVMPIAYRLFPI